MRKSKTTGRILASRDCIPLIFLEDRGMAKSSSPAMASAPFLAESRTRAGFPFYFYLLVCGAACIPLGVLWDISWHSTIGRDTFWTPAHMLTYMGGLIPGLTCGWLALKTALFWHAGGTSGRGRLLGISGSAGLLGHNLGYVYDAALRTVR